MDENRIEGGVREKIGRAQDALGAAVGDAPTQIRGKLNEAAGVSQRLYGRAADRARQTNDWVSDNPWPATGVAAAIGLVVGLILAS
jgi:ElaB/YqjD/DUF883 family membrane-anchored ribosome-binding protein